MLEKRRYTFRQKFHLAPIEAITSIKKQGLLAERSSAGNHRVWMCDWDAIPKIALHLLDHHGFSCHRYMVYQINWWNLPYPIRKHREGVYYYIGNIPVSVMEQHHTVDASSELIQAIMAKECAS